jgi:hypothetical protein
MRKGRRSAERLSYWPELGSRALTRSEQEMPRSFAVNHKCFPMAAEVVISLVPLVLMALTFSTRLQATVAHLAGTETITGTKQFAVPPALPAPAGVNDAANKGYVDAAVAIVGAGSFVSKAGDTMTGPLTLPAETPLL